ncbi:hypothetical protein DVH24_042374 [Malus domestica]|uniref:Uncharacterized protein n=1 Tax=Malus domestica TaxID=3750 RepID=A0A498J378_MALDO|nr:hypothetical protein DVH24_042374 [Malus domestica]
MFPNFQCPRNILRTTMVDRSKSAKVPADHHRQNLTDLVEQIVQLRVGNILVKIPNCVAVDEVRVIDIAEDFDLVVNLAMHGSGSKKLMSYGGIGPGNWLEERLRTTMLTRYWRSEGMDRRGSWRKAVQSVPQKEKKKKDDPYTQPKPARFKQWHVALVCPMAFSHARYLYKSPHL